MFIQRQRVTLRFFLECLTQLRANYEGCILSQAQTLSWNDTIKAARRMQRPRVERTPFQARVHPGFEILVNDRARKLALANGRSSGVFGQGDVEHAVTELLGELKLARRRPPNEVLQFHVQALMTLWRQVSGKDVLFRFVRHDDYEPHFPAPFDRLLPGLFRDVDPTVTATAIATLMRRARQSRAIDGKRFQDFFPFRADGVIDERGAPVPRSGHQLMSFERLVPIFVSGLP